MGMFDSINCEVSIPSLPQDFLEQHGGNSFKITWQTKDLDNSMSLYKITEDGHLHINKIEGFWSNGEDSQYGCLKSLGHFEKTSEYWEPVIGFTGTINFYDSWLHKNFESEYTSPLKFKTGWVEYKATFILGVMTSIELFSIEEPIEYTQEEIIANDEEARLWREDFENKCKASRLENPTPEQKLIDNIYESLSYAIMDENDMSFYINSIATDIELYRKNYDKYYTSRK